MSSKQIASDTLTKIDYEDVLTESIDVLIRDYLQRIARPTTTTPYRCLLRWSVDSEPNMSYSVLVKILKPFKL